MDISILVAILTRLFNDDIDKKIINEAVIYWKLFEICHRVNVKSGLEYFYGNHTEDEFKEYVKLLVDKSIKFKDDDSESHIVTITVKSKTLRDAIDHYKGDLDTLVKDIPSIAMGDHESLIACQNWSDKQRVYTRNGFRKASNDKIKTWLKGED